VKMKNRLNWKNIYQNPSFPSFLILISIIILNASLQHNFFTYRALKSNLMTIIGFIILIVGSISLLFSNDKQQLITCFVGISFIIEGAFLNKSYYNKTYYLSSFALLILLGVIIIYLAFFKHYLDNLYFICGIMGMIVLGIIMLVRSYLRRHENQKIQWKNEW